MPSDNSIVDTDSAVTTLGVGNIILGIPDFIRSIYPHLSLTTKILFILFIFSIFILIIISFIQETPTAFFILTIFIIVMSLWGFIKSFCEDSRLISIEERQIEDRERQIEDRERLIRIENLLQDLLLPDSTD